MQPTMRIDYEIDIAAIKTKQIPETNDKIYT